MPAAASAVVCQQLSSYGRANDWAWCTPPPAALSQRICPAPMEHANYVARSFWGLLRTVFQGRHVSASGREIVRDLCCWSAVGDFDQRIGPDGVSTRLE